MIVLGIESTCDETACSLVEDGRTILSHVIASQADIHSAYGGVFPEIASRHHFEALIPLVDATLHQGNKKSSDIDVIAVAYGPGLIGSLLMGLTCAKTLAWIWNKPLIGINHVEAHLYAAMMEQEPPYVFPALGTVISGGHTFLVKIEDIGHYELIGTTVDDAIGEAFDKVAHLLDLPYPGGPSIEKLALQGNHHRFSFKAGKVKGFPYHFSFSGLKTNVLYTIRGQNLQVFPLLSEQDKADLAASFQKTACQDIVAKSLKAASNFGCRAIYLGGGVSSNRYLRSLFQQADPNIPIFWPTPPLSLDNAAMIAGLGFHLWMQKGCGDSLDLEPQSRIPFHTMGNITRLHHPF